MMLISKIFNRIRWYQEKRKFYACGNNSRVGLGGHFQGHKFITIGDGFSGGKNVSIEAWESYHGFSTGYEPHLKIGNKVSIMDNCQISCAYSVTIGDGVLMGNNCFITDNFHGNGEPEELDIPPAERRLFIKGAVCIKKNVWIGRNVSIMPNVEVGEGCIIGANSVITKDIPPYSVAVGVPAKVIKYNDKRK